MEVSFYYINVVRKKKRKKRKKKKKQRKVEEFRFSCYPNRPSSMVALYWEGISIKAARENSVSFLNGSTFFDMISVKFTNYMQKARIRSHERSAVTNWKFSTKWLPLLTWKLSNARSGILSSNSFMVSKGPSPTPTKIIDRGYSLQLYKHMEI